MMPSELCLGLVCTPLGDIAEVLHDELKLIHGNSARSLLELVAPGSLISAQDFMHAARHRRAAFDWPLTVIGHAMPLHFAGFVENNQLLVVASSSRASLVLANEALMQINNEQTNALRMALKALATRADEQQPAPSPPPSSPDDRALYDDMSRLVNELSSVQRELVRRNADLARLNDEKNQWLGMAAHDLRSPLGVILNYSEFLIDEAGPSLSNEHQQFLALIRSTSEFMYRMIDDVLDVSQIESGALQLDVQSLDLAEFLAGVVRLQQVMAASKHIAVRFDDGPDLPPVPVDKSRLRQVMDNLLDNARKFSQPGTEVRVALGRDAGNAVITVTDQGPGIPAEDRGKLFKPFGRTQVRSTHGERSTGLGLAIVQRIIDAHQGSVSVGSQLGQGTTFTVRLPLQAG